MQKPKQFDWKDSNMELFGSDTDRAVKKESAQTEPAWRAAGECSKPCLFIWRIVKFKVEAWPVEDYGKFYSGDSYIVLNIYKENDTLLYDVHFWIGKYSTQDEYGTAAYKTVELDTFLDDRPIQHREVMNHESALFKSYFKEMTYLKGGADSGFRKVTTREYKPRLLHFNGERKSIVVNEVKLSRNNLQTGDVYILDLGEQAYQWNGNECNKDEKFKAMQYLQRLKSDRGGKLKSETIDEHDQSACDELMVHLPDVPVKEKETDNEVREKSLHKLSDASGSLEFTELSRQSISREHIDEDDVYIIDNGEQVFVYVGTGCSAAESKNALTYAHNYLKSCVINPWSPVTVVANGQAGKTAAEFDKSFD